MSTESGILILGTNGLPPGRYQAENMTIGLGQDGYDMVQAASYDLGNGVTVDPGQ